MFRTQTIAAILVVAALGVGAVIPAALAQDGTDDTATEQTRTSRAERQTERRAELAAGLAEELDLDVSTVEAALDRVHDRFAEQRSAERRADLEERVAAAVEAGELTQEQADVLLEAHDADVLGGFGRGHGGRGHGPGGPPVGATAGADS